MDVPSRTVKCGSDMPWFEFDGSLVLSGWSSAITRRVKAESR